jgi:hypothetical protein
MAWRWSSTPVRKRQRNAQSKSVAPLKNIHACNFGWACTAARAQQEKIVQAQPDYGPTLCVLGLIDAALGRKDLALDEGRRAIALMPVEKDVKNGSLVLQYFAITAAWAGEKELALQQLEAGLRAPTASLMLSYGALKLFPVWDPLRGDPRFEQIVASLAPKKP